jgi:pilus assembly protein Flp/PilA
VSAFTRLARDDSGATAVEYGLVIGGIAAVIIVVVYAFGAKVNNLYSGVTTKWP